MDQLKPPTDRLSRENLPAAMCVSERVQNSPWRTSGRAR